MRSSVGLLCAILAFMAAGCAQSADLRWRSEMVAQIDGLEDVRRDHDTGDVVILAGDKRATLKLLDGKFVLRDGAPRDPIVPGADPIPDGRIARGKGAIAQAWFEEPTAQYQHGVLGDAIEAEVLKVRLQDGTVLAHKLPRYSVFEDLEPRLIDLNGEEMVLAVRAYASAGAAIAVYRVAEGQLQPVGEADPIGIPFRWLNPAGAADFDGDGVTEIAAVVTPHLSGRLTLYQRDGAKFVRETERSGYSTHFIGSTVLAMSVIEDVDGDGVSDIILPSLERDRLAVVTFAGGTATELGSMQLRSSIVTSLVAADLDGKGAEDLVYGLRNGELMVIRR